MKEIIYLKLILTTWLNNSFSQTIAKVLLLTIITVGFLSLQAKAQLDKSTWLFGGKGNFTASNSVYSSPLYTSNSKTFEIGISPNVGYFIMDKLAVGLSTDFRTFKLNGSDIRGSLNYRDDSFAIGPFAKYYFLAKDKPYNILTELSYQRGFYWFNPGKGKANTFSAALGSVIYFNTSIGLEFLVGYYDRKEKLYNNNAKQTGFQIGMGFQIHL